MVEDDRSTIKKKAIQEVKKRASLKGTARKYKIPLTTLAHWCNEAGVKSKHARPPTKATDEQIIQKIKKNKVMTQKQIEKSFGYSNNTLRRRLLPLIRNEKINHITLSGGGKISRIFHGRVDRRLYYITESDLKEWIREQLPEYLPSTLKRAISQKLHEAGIDFEFEKLNKKAIVMDQELFQKIKNKADERNMAVIDFLKEVST